MSKLSNKPDEEKMRVRNKYDQAYENQPWKYKQYQVIFLLKSSDLNVVSTTVNCGRKPIPLLNGFSNPHGKIIVQLH